MQNSIFQKNLHQTIIFTSKKEASRPQLLFYIGRASTGQIYANFQALEPHSHNLTFQGREPEHSMDTIVIKKEKTEVVMDWHQSNIRNKLELEMMLLSEPESFGEWEYFESDDKVHVTTIKEEFPNKRRKVNKDLKYEAKVSVAAELQASRLQLEDAQDTNNKLSKKLEELTQTRSDSLNKAEKIIKDQSTLMAGYKRRLDILGLALGSTRLELKKAHDNNAKLCQEVDDLHKQLKMREVNVNQVRLDAGKKIGELSFQLTTKEAEISQLKLDTEQKNKKREEVLLRQQKMKEAEISKKSVFWTP